jgi:hypothetical protein
MATGWFARRWLEILFISASFKELRMRSAIITTKSRDFPNFPEGFTPKTPFRAIQIHIQ